MDFFQILSFGLYSDDAAQTLEEELEYFVSHGLFSGFGLAISTALFTDGQLLIRQPWSEDYLIDGTTLLTRLPWSENYEIESGEQFIRQPWTEDRLQDSTLYVRQPDSEDYESDAYRFIRQPDSENYLVEEI